MRLLGLGFLLAWPTIWADFEQDFDIARLSSPLDRLYIISAIYVVLYLGFAIYVHRSGRSPWNRRWIIACGLCALVYPGLEFASLASGVFAFDVIAILVRDLAVVGLFLMWNVRLATCKAKTAWIVYAGSMVLGSVLCFSIDAMGKTVSLIATVVLPLASCILLAISQTLPEDESAPEEGGTSWRVPWRPLILSAVFCFSYSLVSHYEGSVMMPVEYGRLIAAVVILVCILCAFNRMDFSLIVKICPSFVIAALLVCGIEGFDDTLGFGKILGSIGYNAFLLYLYIALNAICYRYKAHAEWLFGTVQAICNLVVPLGSLLGDRLLAAGQMSQWLPVDATMSGTAVAVALLSMLLLTEDTLNGTWGIKVVRTGSGDDASQKGQLATEDYLKGLVYRCALIARQYGLTHREEEVLSLLAEGKSFQEIEDALYIAHGTLRVHVRHIYTKLDVHSAEEARAFISAWNGR